MYRTRLLAALVGLGILLSLPAACLAKDYCLNLSGTQLIGIGFTVPKKNSCKPWVGFGFVFSGNSPSSGTGCTSQDGSTLSLTITTSEPESGGSTFFDSAVLSLPSQTGTDHENFVPDGVASELSATGGPCKVSIPAVVSGPPAEVSAGVAR
jgi:hypothetical protein